MRADSLRDTASRADERADAPTDRAAGEPVGEPAGEPTPGLTERRKGMTTSLSSELSRWVAHGDDRVALAEVVLTLARTGVRLATVIAADPLRSALADPAAPAAGTVQPGRNADGDDQKALDVYAETLFLEALADCDVAAVASEETEAPVRLRTGGRLVVTLDPVDGSGNIDANASVGTVFSVLPMTGPDADTETDADIAAEPDGGRPGGGPDAEPGTDITAALLQPGRRQLAAGMILYGPATMLVLTLGEGTDIYVLDPRTRDFRLVRRRVELPTDSLEYAINASNARHWGPGISEYVNDLVSGALGPRERDFNMRWLASLVAEAYRIVIRGGIFLYPADARPGYEEGRIRLLYEANPIAFLVEQAGGAATDGLDPILDLRPARLHQRVPLVFGSRTKVERVRRYLLQPQVYYERYPLFSPRGLFRS